MDQGPRAGSRSSILAKETARKDMGAGQTEVHSMALFKQMSGVEAQEKISSSTLATQLGNYR